MSEEDEDEEEDAEEEDENRGNGWWLLTNLRLRLRLRLGPEISYSREIWVELVITNKSQTEAEFVLEQKCKYKTSLLFSVSYSNVKGGLFWTKGKKYSKNNNWKNICIILSMIPEQGTNQSQDS